MSNALSPARSRYGAAVRGSWTPTFRTSGNAGDIVSVVGWLIEGLDTWPAATLAWLTDDREPPDWLPLLDLFEALDRSEGSGGMLRSPLMSARSLVRQRADGHRGESRWATALDDLGTDTGWDDLALEFQGPAGETGWTELTVLDSTGRLTSAVTGASEDPQPGWIRLSITPRPGTAWFVVTSAGWIVTARTGEGNGIEITIEHSDPTVAESPRRAWGQCTALPGPAPRLVVVDTRLPGGHGYVRNATAVLEPRRGDDRCRLNVRGRALLLPVTWNLLTPFWPLLRPFLTRRLRRGVQQQLDELSSRPEWSRLVSVVNGGA